MICYKLDPMNRLFGLIFDVDGVIADTEPVNARVTIKVLEDMFSLKGAKPEDFDAGIGKGAEKYVQAGADAHGLTLTDEQIEAAAQLREQYLIKAIQQEQLPAFAGVLELIKAAFCRGDFRLAIATSASLELSRAILESAQVPYRKMVYVTGSEITRKKPDPELFLVAASRMHLSPPHCVVIEDAPSGVQAAKAAGAKCIAVTNSTGAANLSRADLVCNSLEQIDLQTIQNLIDGLP
ncbi:MAG: HAD family phosphatase [Phycisphaerales bacterium]|nr:MAG: HAD family phosphatase [Phycisphaerales bacterium]